MAIESGLKRERSSISFVVMYNIKDENEEWISQVYRKYSWVIMQPGNHGQYRVKGKAYEDLAKHWKGRILDFKVALGGKIVKEVLIQHVFMKNFNVLYQMTKTNLQLPLSPSKITITSISISCNQR